MGRILYIPRRFASIKYGLGYNWPAVMDARHIANTGWEVPSMAYWVQLAMYIDPTYNPYSPDWDGPTANDAGYHLKESGTTYWNTGNTGINDVGFNARGHGVRMHTDGSFVGLKSESGYWTSTNSDSPGSAFSVGIYYNLNYCLCHNVYASYKRGCGLRLINPSTSLSDGQTGTYTGNDHKVYRTKCFGGVEWLVNDLAEIKFGNGDLITMGGADPTFFTNAEWAALTTEGSYAFNNDWSNV